MQCDSTYPDIGLVRSGGLWPPDGDLVRSGGLWPPDGDLVRDFIQCFQCIARGHFAPLEKIQCFQWVTKLTLRQAPPVWDTRDPQYGTRETPSRGHERPRVTDTRHPQ